MPKPERQNVKTRVGKSTILSIILIQLTSLYQTGDQTPSPPLEKLYQFYPSRQCHIGALVLALRPSPKQIVTLQLQQLMIYEPCAAAAVLARTVAVGQKKNLLNQMCASLTVSLMVGIYQVLAVQSYSKTQSNDLTIFLNRTIPNDNYVISFSGLI